MSTIVFEKSLMKVFELKQQPPLLVGSGGYGNIDPMDNPKNLQ